jgi:hypothetical protein
MPELRGKVGDGVNQAADFISATASIPSLNFVPLTTFGHKPAPGRRSHGLYARRTTIDGERGAEPGEGRAPSLEEVVAAEVKMGWSVLKICGPPSVRQTVGMMHGCLRSAGVPFRAGQRIADLAFGEQEHGAGQASSAHRARYIVVVQLKKSRMKADPRFQIDVAEQRPRPLIPAPYQVPPPSCKAKESHGESAGQRLFQRPASASQRAAGTAPRITA